MNPIRSLIKELAEKHGRRRESLLPIMLAVVEREKYLSEYSMVEIAREVDIPASEVYGTATFYSFIETNWSVHYPYLQNHHLLDEREKSGAFCNTGYAENQTG